MPKALAMLAVISVAADCNGGGSAGSNGTGGTGTSGGPPAPVGTLWVGGSGSLSPSALLDGGSTPAFGQTCVPASYRGSPTPLDGAGVVDGEGNLWTQFPYGTVGSGTTAPIYEWKAGQLGSCSSLAPSQTFTLTNTLNCGGDGAGCNPLFAQMAFDSAGNLWGAESGEPSLFVYRASDLAAGGSSLTAAAMVPAQQCGPLDVLCTPAGLAFDGAGNLWIGNGYSVIAYTPATLSAILGGDAGSPPADMLLTTMAAVDFEKGGGNGSGYYSHYNFNALAFDRSGDLWVAVENGQGDIEQQIVEFSKAQLAALGTDSTPTPVLTITDTAAQKSNLFLGWGSLAFDADGNLWSGVTMFKPNLYRFSPASLADGGLPDISLTVTGDPSVSLVFDPIPPGLPLQP